MLRFARGSNKEFSNSCLRMVLGTNFPGIDALGPILLAPIPLNQPSGLQSPGQSLPVSFPGLSSLSLDKRSQVSVDLHGTPVQRKSLPIKRDRRPIVKWNVNPHPCLPSRSLPYFTENEAGKEPSVPRPHHWNNNVRLSFPCKTRVFHIATSQGNWIP